RSRNANRFRKADPSRAGPGKPPRHAGYPCHGRNAGAPGAGVARSAPAARRASRQEGAQRIQVDLGQLLQRAELDVLVELVDAGIDRPEFNHLRADLGDEAGVRSAAGGGELGCAAGVLLDDRGNDLHQPAARRDERFRAQGPLDGVVHAMLLQDHFQPTTWQVSNVHGGTSALNVIPGSLQLDFNFRYSTASTERSLKERLEAVLKKHGARYAIEWTLGAKPFITSRGRLVEVVSTVIKKHTG